MSQIENGIG